MATAGALRRPRSDDRIQLIMGLKTPQRRPQIGVGSPVAALERSTERFPLCIRLDGNRHPLVITGGGVYALGRRIR